MASNPHYDHGLLWRAIAASLLLHAVLLLQPGLGTMSSHPAAAPSLMALLRPRAESPAPGAAVPVPASHTVHAPATTREVSTAATSAPVPTTATPQIAAEAAAVPLGSPNASSNGNGTAPSVAAVTGEAELDFAEARKSYLFAIAAEARRVKKYPARALAAGWSGKAFICVKVAVGGNVQKPELCKSSGYADIDQVALDMVGFALTRTPLPESLRTRNFEFEWPVSFSLGDE